MVVHLRAHRTTSIPDISRLRKALRENGARESPLLTRPGGYLLRLEPDQLDVATFEHLLAEGQQALAAGEAALAATALEEALSLWRGEPLADLALEPFARIAVERLAELRLRAVEAQIEAGLALGRHATLVPELEALVAREPLREGLRRQLMLALYRCDRQAAALEVYRTTQRLLKDELGLAPSHELARLERLILTHDPELDLAPLETSSSTSSPTPVRARRALYQTNLPVPATPFLGRESDLTHLHRLLSDDNVRLLTLTGPGGSGKTRLALRSARAAIPGFPGGAWWVSLAALRDPTLVIEVAARALGSTSDLVDHIDGKRLLLILDNFEHLIPAAVTDVTQLLERCPRVTVLVRDEPREASTRSRMGVHGRFAARRGGRGAICSARGRRAARLHPGSRRAQDLCSPGQPSAGNRTRGCTNEGSDGGRAARPT